MAPVAQPCRSRLAWGRVEKIRCFGHVRTSGPRHSLGAIVRKGTHPEREVKRPTIAASPSGAAVIDIVLPHSDSPSRVMATARLRRVAPFRNIAPVDHFVRLFGISVGELLTICSPSARTLRVPRRTSSVMTDILSMAPGRRIPGAILLLGVGFGGFFCLFDTPPRRAAAGNHFSARRITTGDRLRANLAPGGPTEPASHAHRTDAHRRRMARYCRALADPAHRAASH